jgi:hypothetical protein
MRTKTLLLAGAALAFSLATSQAQVYSANIVGYANVLLPGNGQFTLVATPFDDGNGNILSNIITAPLPGGVANPLGQSKITTFGIPTPGVPNIIAKGATGAWSANPSLPPGTGYYIQNGKPGGGAPDLTNTFVGTVIPLVAASVTNDIPNGYSIQGSVIPYAGNIAISLTPGGDANMNVGGSLSSPDAAHRSQITYWNTAGQNPGIATKGITGNWNNTVAVGVAQGFYIFNPNADTNVVETLAP